MAIGRENFFKAHWDWLVAAAGVAALGASAALYMQTAGETPEDAAANAAAAVKARLAKPANEGVAPVALDGLQKVLRGLKTPPSLREFDPRKQSWLASERRVFCVKGDPDSKEKECGKPIPGGLEKCPFCGMKQKVVKVSLDADNDGMPNDWEKKYGFNPNDPADANEDADGDGFTNLEEYLAKTDPRDAKSHPDYLDFLKVNGEIRQTMLPFWLKEANPIPGNTYRLTLVRTDAKQIWESNLRVKVGDPVKSADGKYDSGYVLKSFTRKLEDQVIAGARNKATRKVDVSTAEFERVADGKKITAVMGKRNIPVEVEAELAWSREGGKTLAVRPGSEFELHKGTKYKAVAIRQGKEGGEVTVKDMASGKEKTIR